MNPKVRTIPAGEFKAKCLALLDDVRDEHEEIIVTKRGRPVAKLVPIGRPEVPDLRHMLAGPLGDIESPIEAEWEAES
jgi:prevent-host-death family protein